MRPIPPVNSEKEKGPNTLALKALATRVYPLNQAYLFRHLIFVESDQNEYIPLETRANIVDEALDYHLEINEDPNNIISNNLSEKGKQIYRDAAEMAEEYKLPLRAIEFYRKIGRNEEAQRVIDSILTKQDGSLDDQLSQLNPEAYLRHADQELVRQNFGQAAKYYEKIGLIQLAEASKLMHRMYMTNLANHMANGNRGKDKAIEWFQDETPQLDEATFRALSDAWKHHEQPHEQSYLQLLRKENNRSENMVQSSDPFPELAIEKDVKPTSKK